MKSTLCLEYIVLTADMAALGVPLQTSVIVVVLTVAYPGI